AAAHRGRARRCRTVSRARGAVGRGRARGLCGLGGGGRSAAGGGRVRLVSRCIDRGAITAAYVGIGMAVTIVVSFLLFIPIEWIIWLLALPSGLMMVYNATQRPDRRAGPLSRIVINGLFAGVVTGVTAAVLLLAIKGIFFYAD